MKQTTKQQDEREEKNRETLSTNHDLFEISKIRLAN